ncbi:hypothetical protein PRIPAC_79393 [Pristionchus pacificus]|uniref:Membrane transporter n=1 Tax=Pristionchus pacificus TaxID=54126 RepID=A0A2A6BDT2_PRIPA|nr:hypothetical protein PRIPAC_79393 [Pristionchus pacificus]|eukprot:PDM64060.1 membrane transporter [Pristionchus pacificus]
MKSRQCLFTPPHCLLYLISKSSFISHSFSIYIQSDRPLFLLLSSAPFFAPFTFINSFIMADATALIETKVELPSSPLRLWISAIVLALSGGFHFGYNLVITNPAQDAFLKFLNESSGPMSNDSLNNYWPIIVSLLYFGGIFGSFYIRIAADRLGRKRSIYLTTVGQTISCLLSTLSYFILSAHLYAFSRFLLGFFQSMAVGIAPLFISESSPPHIRGRISLSTGLFVQLSIVVGSIIAMPQILGDSWYILYVVEVIILLIPLLTIPFFPDSPSYLAVQGQTDASLRSIIFYHGGDENYSFSVLGKFVEEANEKEETVGIWKVFTERINREPVMNGCMVMLAMISSGIVVINGYAVNILVQVGLSIGSAAWANIGISVIAVVGCLLSSFFVDRYGRRPLLLSTLTLILISNMSIVVLMYLFEITENVFYGQLLLIPICIYALLFSTGPAPLSFFISAELCSLSIRGSAMTWANVTNAVYRSIVLAIFPPLVLLYSTSTIYFILFLPISLFTLIYLFVYLPETKPKKRESTMEKSRVLIAH